MSCECVVEDNLACFPCLLGLTILLLQTIFVGKKSNEKWKMESTKQIRSIRSIRGQKNKRLTEREAWLTLKMGVSGVSGISGISGVSGVSGVSSVSGVSGVSGVSSVPHPYSLPFRERPGVGFSPAPSAKRG